MPKMAISTIKRSFERSLFMPIPTINPATYQFPTFQKPANLPVVAPILYNAAAKAMTFLIAGGAAYVLWPVLAPPFFTISATIVATRLVIKVAELYNLKLIEKTQLYLAQFRDKHKYLQIAAVVGILAVSIFCWQAACVLALPFGIYAAVVVGLDYYIGAQTVRRRQELSGSPPSGRAVYLS